MGMELITMNMSISYYLSHGEINSIDEIINYVLQINLDKGLAYNFY